MFLGIDVGTGGTRAVLINRAGAVIASHSSDHAPIHSEHIGWAEQHPDDWWRAVKAAVTGALAACDLTGSIVEAVGLTGQMHGCVMLNASGQVLRPALIWCDQRTQPQCDWLTEKIGFERLIELTCNPALPNFTLTKLLWVREHEPELFAKIAHVLCPKDYIPLQTDRRARHGHAGSLRHVAARRNQPPLVGRGCRRSGDPDVVASQTL